MGKRVCCLYRVSTLKQVEKDDIPMQKQCCHEFAEQMGWDIVREFSEKGISGFKVSAKKRDAIQEIQREATLKTFDILLVFMFDRLGRKDDETPFIVEWFVNNGIEVWSAEEGQQRFDNHVDKLLNYIRYWQASGESIKTSIRTKTRLGHIVQEGRFRGGKAPYGYQLVKKVVSGKRIVSSTTSRSIQLKLLRFAGYLTSLTVLATVAAKPLPPYRARASSIFVLGNRFTIHRFKIFLSM